MPTYQYKCKDCGIQFEEFQSMTERAIDKCPECGGKAERQISGGAGFLFKGSGFYITDYRSDSYKKAAELDKPSVVTKTSDSGKSKSVDTKKEVKKTA
jgi:putative FmdB family regulatory protein